MRKEFSTYYIQFFKERAALLGFEAEGPQYYIDEWKEFVDWCVEYGYSYSYFEFDEDTIVRDEIEPLLYDQDLADFEEHKYFVSQVDIIDNNLKSIAHSYLIVKRPWWKTIILKYGCNAYTANVKQLFDADIEVFPNDN